MYRKIKLFSIFPQNCIHQFVNIDLRYCIYFHIVFFPSVIFLLLSRFAGSRSDATNVKNDTCIAWHRTKAIFLIYACFRRWKSRYDRESDLVILKSFRYGDSVPPKRRHWTGSRVKNIHVARGQPSTFGLAYYAWTTPSWHALGV